MHGQNLYAYGLWSAVVFSILLGFYLSCKSWSLIHASEGKELVTHGIYARIRHPQYVGLFLITLGLLVQWPTLITLIMWPILTFSYYRLSKKEEAEVSRQIPEAYSMYKEKVPTFVPRLNSNPKQASHHA